MSRENRRPVCDQASVGGEERVGTKLTAVVAGTICCGKAQPY